MKFRSNSRQRLQENLTLLENMSYLKAQPSLVNAQFQYQALHSTERWKLKTNPHGVPQAAVLKSSPCYYRILWHIRCQRCPWCPEMCSIATGALVQGAQSQAALVKRSREHHVLVFPMCEDLQEMRPWSLPSQVAFSIPHPLFFLIFNFQF